MKVVLFCGGLGTRLGEVLDDVPKPLVRIGYRPILWHVMRYYAHFGHKEFILCLGYRADKIKEYFLNYNEYLSNDFIMKRGGKDLELQSSDIEDWTITFVDTGLRTSIGQRLKAVEKHLEGEEMFLANYADGLTDLPLPDMIESLRKSGKTAAFLCTRPPHTFHVVALDERDGVRSVQHVRDTGIVINAGYYVFRREILDQIGPGEDLVLEPFQRLIAAGQLLAYRYDNFWCMDTFREHQVLTDMYNSGHAPWEIWNERRANGPGNGA